MKARSGIYHAALWVVVHRVNTDGPGPRVSGQEFGELVRLILAARTQ